MSFSNPLADRERALEEAFFQKETKRLLEAMHEKRTREEQTASLSNALNIEDSKILEPLIDAGLRSSNRAALVMAPLICVAWADGVLDNEEQKLIANSAIALGVEPSSEGAKLIDLWLSHPPHSDLLEAWIGCIRALCSELDSKAIRDFQNDILGRAKRIAHSLEKSFLRGGGPTEKEKEVLVRIESAFMPEGLRSTEP